MQIIVLCIFVLDVQTYVNLLHSEINSFVNQENWFFCAFFWKLYTLLDAAMKKNLEKLEEKWTEHAERKKDYDQTRWKIGPKDEVFRGIHCIFKNV